MMNPNDVVLLDDENAVVEMSSTTIPRTTTTTVEPTSSGASVHSISSVSTTATGQNYSVPLLQLPSFMNTTSVPPQSRRCKNPRYSRRRRKRRPFFIDLAVSLQKSHVQGHPWEEEEPYEEYKNDPHRRAYETPDFPLFAQLSAALLLCVLLGMMSAWDAKNQCTTTLSTDEAYAVRQLVDDDNVEKNYNNNNYDNEDAFFVTTSSTDEANKCTQMFQKIVLPAGIGTSLAAMLSLIILYRYNKLVRKQQHNKDHGIATHSSTMIRVIVACVILFCIMLAFQIYHVTAIMLTPRADDDMVVNNNNYNGYDDENNNYEESNGKQIQQQQQNPYQSLAAVDRFGHVGANANLYYLSWISIGLTVALVYQGTTACFRVLRAARRHADGLLVMKQQQQQQTPPLPPTSWDRGSSDNNPNYKLILGASRAAWYSSLYRLRYRTGIWTAAFISCLVIVASAQYIWNQALWPYVAKVIHDETVDVELKYHYFSVCQLASQQSNGYFSPQLCRRTLAAWLDGLVGAVLCAVAIVWHLAARYRNHIHDAAAVSSFGADKDSPTHHGEVVAAAVVGAQQQQHPPGMGHATSDAPYHFYERDVMHLLNAEGMCDKTTTTAWENVSPDALMSRYYSHHHPKRFSLRTELLLSIVLSLLLGFHAVLVTGVNGPGLQVGNLYYSTWISFLLCLRICLGCVEEYYNIEDDEDEEDGHGKQIGGISKHSEQSDGFNATIAKGEASHPSSRARSFDDDNRCRGLEIVPSSSSARDVKHQNSILSQDGEPWKSVESVSKSATEKNEKTRVKRVRCYFFLSNFSMVCAASTFDAAFNQKQSLSREQQYMLVAPCFVALLSILLFGLCLSKRYYSVISKFWIGGLLSMITFGLWLGNLVLTMHSEGSWAVNSIGEIEMANLYYFSWASMITAGVQMTSFVKAKLGITNPDYMAVVWVTICKVCFVVLGASMHIWHTIAGNCEFDEITLGAATFCSRTILAIIISLTGMLVGGLVVLVRLFVNIFAVCQCSRVQTHIEMLISIFLVFLFGVSVALITGIGGPGQTVGDLYYSIWLAFWVSLGIFISCFNELREEEKDIERSFRLANEGDNKVCKDPVNGGHA